MRFYWTLFAVDALTLLVLIYFFLDGLRYSASGSMVATWLPILIVPAAVLAGASVLRGKGKQGLATLLLGLMALPPLAFVLFFGLLLALNPSWQ